MFARGRQRPAIAEVQREQQAQAQWQRYQRQLETERSAVAGADIIEMAGNEWCNDDEGQLQEIDDSPGLLETLEWHPATQHRNPERLVEKPGNRRLQGIFLAAVALGAGKDGGINLEVPDRCMADFNTVDVLSKTNTVWVSCAERDKAVEAAQKELRDTRQGFASIGLTIESLADLKPIAEAGAKYLLGLGLDTEKKEVQSASMVAGKALLLLDDKDGAKELVRACERGTGISSDERTRALGLLGVKYPDALKKIAFDSTHVLYGEARMALATVLWNIPEFQEKLPNYEAARISPMVADTFKNEVANMSSAPNWRALLSTPDGIATFKVWPFATTGWLSASGKALGTADFGWSVPYLQAGGRRGIGAVAMIRKTKVEVVPLEALLPVEDPLKDSGFSGLATPKFKMDGSEEPSTAGIF